MNAYVDSSVVIRKVFGQRAQLDEWGKIKVFVASTLLFIECSRIVDRTRLSRVAASRADPYRETLEPFSRTSYS